MGVAQTKFPDRDEASRTSLAPKGATDAFGFVLPKIAAMVAWQARKMHSDLTPEYRTSTSHYLFFYIPLF